MTECQECGDDVPSARQAMGIDVCVLCLSGHCRLVVRGHKPKIITGGRKA